MCLLRSVLELLLNKVCNEKKETNFSKSTIYEILNKHKNFLISEKGISEEFFKILDKMRKFSNKYSHSEGMKVTKEDIDKIPLFFKGICLFANKAINDCVALEAIKEFNNIK